MKYLLLCLIVLSVFIYSCSKNDDIAVPIESQLSGALPVIIVIGQSNADGNALYETAPSWLEESEYEMKNFVVWNSEYNYFSPYKLKVNTGADSPRSKRFGFDIFFAKKYLESYGGQLLCIKHTVGNTAISPIGASLPGRWTADYDAIPKTERKLFLEFINKIAAVKNYAKQNNLELNIIAVLYHQGEGDADDYNRSAEYKDNFPKLLYDIRNELNDETLLIINGTIIERNNDCKRINDVFIDQNKIDENFVTIDMEDQPNIGDNLHFDASACKYLGEKMFETYQIKK